MSAPRNESQPLSRRETLQQFIAGLTAGDAQRFREGTVSAVVSWTVDTGKRDRRTRRPIVRHERRKVPVDVLYAPRTFLPSRTVYRQGVSYDDGLTEHIGDIITVARPRYSKDRLASVARQIPTPSVRDLRMGRHGWEDVPDRATVTLVYDEDKTKKITVVKLDPSAPGDEKHESNVRVIVDTVVNPLRARSPRHAKVVVLTQSSSDEFLSNGTVTEEANVRTSHKKFPKWHRGAIRARRFVERMLDKDASHTLAIEHKPGTRLQETHKATAPLTVALTNSPKQK